MTSRILIRLGLIACWLIVVSAPSTAQQISYTVSFNDSGGSFADLYQPITQHIQAAGAAWNTYLRPTTNVILEVQVAFPTDITSASGRSLVSTQVGTIGGRRLLEQGAATEIRTGIDPNGSGIDIELNFNPTYMRNQLWLDPDPIRRTAAVPTDKTDAMSVMLHEFGHVLAINGFRDGVTGDLPGDFLSTFDQHVAPNAGVLEFNGPVAKQQYGGRPVPLTIGRYAHLGNRDPQPGSDLLPDLMNGIEFTNGTRYDISLLDVAILADSGVPVVPVPEPVLVLSVAAAGLAGLVMRRSSSLTISQYRAATTPVKEK